MGDTQEAAGERLLQTLRSMKAYDPAGDYYALTLGANRRGGLVSADALGGLLRAEPALGDPRRVPRRPRIHPQGLDRRNALVGRQVAEDRLSSVIAPKECVHDGSAESGGFGYLVTQHLPDDSVERRTPTRKLRMQVLKRDGFRCVVCGRRASDHTDIELHLHHLVPWRMAGRRPRRTWSRSAARATRAWTRTSNRRCGSSRACPARPRAWTWTTPSSTKRSPAVARSPGRCSRSAKCPEAVWFYSRVPRGAVH